MKRSNLEKFLISRNKDFEKDVKLICSEIYKSKDTEFILFFLNDKVVLSSRKEIRIKDSFAYQQFMYYRVENIKEVLDIQIIKKEDNVISAKIENLDIEIERKKIEKDDSLLSLEDYKDKISDLKSLFKKEIEIFPMLKRMVNVFTINYKTDTIHDIHSFKDQKKDDEIVIYFRECGTEFIKCTDVCIDTSYSNTVALYYSPKDVEIAVKIKITNIKDGLFFGIFEEINVEKFQKYIKNNMKTPISITMKITTNDDKTYEYTSYDLNNAYFDMLLKLDIPVENVKEKEVLKYNF